MTKSKKNIYYIMLISGINLFFIYYYKYSSNKLSISDFSLFNTGNIINLLITLFFLLGCIVLLKKTKNISTNLIHTRIFLFFSIIYLSPLIIVVMFNILDLPFANEYLFGYPFKKILPLIFFVFNQLVFLFVAFLVWFVIYGLTLKAYFYSFLAVLFTSFLLILFTLIYSFWIIEYDHSTENQQYDYGIILGAAVWSGNIPSPIFIGRIDKGAQLYQQKAIKNLQLTGGNAPGELSEAKTAFNYLKEKYNLDSNYILIEEETSTTNEQIRYIKNNFVQEEYESNFIFISDEFHLMRIKEMADFYGLKAKVVSSEYKLNFKQSLYYRLRDSIGLILFWFFGV